uniref:Uncharacterized protein n=1 Tax=Cacopsylla melanoneura TaxID=428564 RepID=A0A8D8X396_9HEMI
MCALLSCVEGFCINCDYDEGRRDSCWKPLGCCHWFHSPTHLNQPLQYPHHPSLLLLHHHCLSSFSYLLSYSHHLVSSSHKVFQCFPYHPHPNVSTSPCVFYC